MAVISDSKTASEMRDEVIDCLIGRYIRAGREATVTHRLTRTERATRLGFANAISCEIDFWRHVWVEGKQHRTVETVNQRKEGE